MGSSLRTILLSVLALVVVAGAALGGWFIIDRRAEGSGRAAIPTPTSSPGVTASPNVTATPSPSPSGTLPPPRRHWLVAVLRHKIPVYDKPSKDSRVRVYLNAKTFGVETVCLVRKIEETSKKVWYNVWLPTGPNGARGWIAEGGVVLYPVYHQIVIDLSARSLSVVEGDQKVVGRYPVAIGTSQNPTPIGDFFVTTKIKPVDQTTAYGVFALALSAYSPALVNTPAFGDGQVAIHGTNRPALIGQAVSHGCIRMKNKDILAVSKLAKAGCPVTIKR